MIEIKPDSVIFKRWPMPPSSNHLFVPFRGRLIKSSEGRKYSAQCKIWGTQNRGTVNKIKEILKDKTLRVDCVFVFPESKLLTKKNTLKKCDWMNRLKQTCDELSDLIGVDDSCFISGYCCKKISDNDESYVDIKISAENLEWRDKS